MTCPFQQKLFLFYVAKFQRRKGILLNMHALLSYGDTMEWQGVHLKLRERLFNPPMPADPCGMMSRCLRTTILL
jgi:hypothetical protein